MGLAVFCQFLHIYSQVGSGSGRRLSAFFSGRVRVDGYRHFLRVELGSVCLSPNLGSGRVSGRAGFSGLAIFCPFLSNFAPLFLDRVGVEVGVGSGWVRVRLTSPRTWVGSGLDWVGSGLCQFDFP